MRRQTYKQAIMWLSNSFTIQDAMSEDDTSLSFLELVEVVAFIYHKTPEKVAEDVEKQCKNRKR